MKKNLKLIATIILKNIAAVLYWLVCIVRPVKWNRVVIATPRHDRLTDNLLFLYEKMQEDKPEMEYIILHRKINARKVTWWNSIGYMCRIYYYLATSRFFIIDDYFLPLYLVKVRSGTEVVQLWHASGPLKKVGLSLRGSIHGPSEDYLKVVPIHKNYDYVFVNSDFEKQVYSEAFGMKEEKIYAVGTPRTDYIFENLNCVKEKEHFLSKYPEYKNKELILYAPTFRGKSNESAPYKPSLDIEKIAPLLIKNNKVVIFNLHPYMKVNTELINQSDKRAFFWNVNEFTIEELLKISDALISDYSSVIYDFSILEKPIALYCYDYAEYIDQRGLYIDIKKLVPDTFFEKEDDLLQWILADDKNRDEAKLLKERNFKYSDGMATSRIMEILFKA